MNQYKKFLLILFVLSLFAPLQAQDQEIERWMTRGKEAYEDGDYDRAINYFEEVAKIDAYHQDLYQYRGNAFFRVGEYKEAELDYLEAIKLLPKPDQSSSRVVESSYILLDPSGTEELNQKYALLYNNLGVTRFKQGKRSAAMKAFEMALEYDPKSEIADKNDRSAYSNRGRDLEIEEQVGAANRRLRGEEDFGRRKRKPKQSYENESNRRPVSTWRRPDRESFTMMLDTREEREEALSIAETTNSDNPKKETVFDRILKPKVFIKRKVGKKGKTYKKPNYVGTTQSYLSIHRVLIKDRSTFVMVKIENLDDKAYWVSLAPKNSSEAYKIIARGDKRHREYKLKNVTHMAEFPRTQEIKANADHYFVLEFERIPDNVGIISIVEGENQRASAWNFYQIDLRK